ncbi:MAG: hypothetical protein M3261_01115 [Thermoproteota archaeon]|nr:hypothetical protein [Thermoproteota archaeon]
MACSGSDSLVPFHPIAISILFHHYKELRECEKQINKLMGGSNNDNNQVDDLKEYSQNETEEQDNHQVQHELTLFDF